MKKIILLIALAVLVMGCDCNCCKTYPKKIYVESSDGYNYIIQTDSIHTYMWRNGIITKLE